MYTFFKKAVEFSGSNLYFSTDYRIWFYVLKALFCENHECTVSSYRLNTYLCGIIIQDHPTCDEVLLLFAKTFFSWFYLHFTMISIFTSFNNSSDSTMLSRPLWEKLRHKLKFLSELIWLSSKKDETKTLTLTNFLNSPIDFLEVINQQQSHFR